MAFLTENRRKFDIHKYNGEAKALVFGSFLSWEIVSTAMYFPPGGRSDSLCEENKEDRARLTFDKSSSATYR